MKAWGDISCIEIAKAVENKRFIASSTTQEYLIDKWRGTLHREYFECSSVRRGIRRELEVCIYQILIRLF